MTIVNKMAEDETAKKDFTDILNRLDRKFEIIHTKWSQKRNFEIKFRTQIPRNTEDFNSLCDEWVDLFSDATGTVWVKKISNTGPKIRFRKQYQCWTHEGKVIQKELLFDARRCKATLDIKVLTDNPLTRRKNRHIRMGLNIVVKINFNHLHDVDTLKPSSFFVHSCKPLPEPPKVSIQPNERLPELIAKMVESGQKKTKKILNPEQSEQSADNNNTLNVQSEVIIMEQDKINLNQTQDSQKQQIIIPEQIQEIQTIQLTNVQQPLQFIQNVPIQGVESVKLEIQPSSLHQFTQVVVSGSNDISEQLLMCQPLMFESSQLIPLTTNLSSHFVQLQSHNINLNQQHYL